MVVIVTLEAIKMHSRACIIWQLPLLYRSSNRERDNRGRACTARDNGREVN
jgi:hypothetical protein